MWDVKPGDKVTPKPPQECPPPPPNPSKAVRLTPGAVYTVRETCSIWDGSNMVPGIRLVETPNPVALYTIGPGGQTGMMEPAYILSFFRKVVGYGGMETLRSFLMEPNKKISDWHPSDHRPRVVKKEKTK